VQRYTIFSYFCQILLNVFLLLENEMVKNILLTNFILCQYSKKFYLCRRKVVKDFDC